MGWQQAGGPKLRSEFRALQSFGTEGLQHGSHDLHMVLKDATKAQRLLKQRLIGDWVGDRRDGAKWMTGIYNDRNVVGLEDPCRGWKSGAQDPIPCGAFFDPGTKQESDVHQKAARRVSKPGGNPEYHTLVDISRIGT